MACSRTRTSPVDDPLRNFSPDLEKDRPFKCDDCGLWHSGQLPKLVLEGVLLEDEWYGRNGHPPYGEILIGCREVLRGKGGHSFTFARTGDGRWIMSAMFGAIEVTSGPYEDPVSAAEELLAGRTVPGQTSNPAQEPTDEEGQRT
jgi:hypothetical protein